MKHKKKLTVLLVGFLLLSFTASGLAVKHTKKPGPKPLQNKILQGIIDLPFTMVGGKLCSTYPDDVKKYYSVGTYTCPSDLSGGCAVDKWQKVGDDWYANYLSETKMNPGEEMTVFDDRIIESYYCNKDCTCDRYESQGCGKGSCSDDEMYRIRDCDEHKVDGKMEPCSTEEVCVSGYDECEQPSCFDEDPCSNLGSGTHCWEGNSVTCQDEDGDSCLEASWEYCGSDSCKSQGRVCRNGDVYEERICYDRGCSRGSCYENQDKNYDLLQSCGSNEVCKSGRCVEGTEPKPIVNIIDMIINIFK